VKLYFIGRGKRSLEEFVRGAHLLIAVPSVIAEVRLEVKTARGDFIMETVRALLEQEPNYTNAQIASKLLLSEDIIKTVRNELAHYGEHGGSQISHRIGYAAYNAVTSVLNSSPDITRDDLHCIGECSESDGFVRFTHNSVSDSAIVIKGTWRDGVIASGKKLSDDAARVFASAQIGDDGVCETVTPYVSGAEEKCYLLSAVAWETSGKFYSFANYTVYGIGFGKNAEKSADNVMYEAFYADKNAQYAALKKAMRERFERFAAAGSTVFGMIDKRIEEICEKNKVRIGDKLKAKISERQRAFSVVSGDDGVAPYIMKLFSVIEWELFEVLKGISKSQREKIRDYYKALRKNEMPKAVKNLFATAELDYDDGYYDRYFAKVYDGSIHNQLVEESMEPTFDTMFISMLIHNERCGGVDAVLRLKTDFRQFMTLFDTYDLKNKRNREKHGGRKDDEFVNGLRDFAAATDKALLGVDFVNEVGAVKGRRVRAKISEDLSDVLGVSKERLQSMFDCYESEDSDFYNRCEQLLVEELGAHTTQVYSFASKDERNDKLKSVLATNGVAYPTNAGFVKSTHTSDLLPQRFIGMILCSKSKRLFAALADGKIFTYIDEINNAIGHTNAVFEPFAAAQILEKTEIILTLLKTL